MAHETPLFETVLQPHRSLNRFGFRLVMTVVILVNLAFAAVMTARGAWPVAGFMGLDVLAIYIAFRLSYGQARAREVVTVARDDFVLRRVDPKGHAREWRCPSYWARVDYDDSDDRGTLVVRSHGRTVEVGRFLDPDQRASLARELSDALARARTYSPA